MFLTFVTVMFRILEFFTLGFLRKSLWGFSEEQIQLALAASFLSSRSLASAISRARLWDLYMSRASPRLGFPRMVLLRLYMFVVSGHLYRPLLLSQSWELGGKILGGFGTHPPTFFGARLGILVFF